MLAKYLMSEAEKNGKKNGGKNLKKENNWSTVGKKYGERKGGKSMEIGEGKQDQVNNANSAIIFLINH